jgi:hypothetical protein
MSTTAIPHATGGSLESAERAGAAGVIASLPLAMWLMIVGIFASTLWAPPQGIAQAIGIGHTGHDFQLVPFILGLMGHLINAAILGLIFLRVATILNVRGLAVVLVGTIYGIVAYATIYWVLLRGLLSGTSGSFLSADPQWVFIIGHMMFGAVLGLLLAYGPLRRQEVR